MELIAAVLLLVVGIAVSWLIEFWRFSRAHHQKAEASLHAVEEEMHLIANSLPGAAMRGSRDFRYRWVNRPLSEWVGAPPESIIGRTVEEVMGSDSFAGLRPKLERVLAGERITFEEEMAIPGQGRRWVQATYTPTHDRGGHIDGWVGLILDVDQRKRAEHALAESEETFRRIVETAKEGIWLLDQNGRVTFVNERMARFLGYPAEEILGRSKWDFLFDDDRSRARSRFERRRSGIGDQFDVRFRRRNGSEIWMLMVARPILNQEGEFLGVLDMFTDMTETRHAEETIRSLLRISCILNSTLDIDDLLDSLVQEAVRLAGAESGVAGLCTPKGMVSHRYYQEGTWTPLERCWVPMEGLPGWVMVNRVPYVTNDAAGDEQIDPGLRQRFRVRRALSVPILSAHGDILGFFEIHNKKDGSGFTSLDQEQLTGVAQSAAIAVQNALAYRKLKETDRILQDTDRRKDEFLATMAHELRNPLAPIRNSIQLMRMKGSIPPDLEAARDMIDRQVQQMVHLIDDLLDVSRVTRNALRVQKRDVTVEEVLQAALESSRPLIDEAGHQLTLTLPGQPVFLHGDPVRLAQAFSNLLNNASKYTEPGGKIWVHAERHGDTVVVSVRDTGVGIAPEYLPRVFEMFSQAAPARERSHSGLGVGLSLVRAFVNLHGGSVEVHSAGLHQGSEFVVRLPVQTRTPAATLRNRAIPGFPGSGPPRRVLVVDDKEDNANSLGIMLDVMGHETRTATDGAAAIDLAGTFRPEVILLDIGMPKMNGYEVARHIRKQPWGGAITVIAMTGWGQEEDKRRSRESGFDLHLVKPVDPWALARILQTLPPERPGTGSGESGVEVAGETEA